MTSLYLYQFPIETNYGTQLEHFSLYTEATAALREKDVEIALLKQQIEQQQQIEKTERTKLAEAILPSVIAAVLEPFKCSPPYTNSIASTAYNIADAMLKLKDE